MSKLIWLFGLFLCVNAGFHTEDNYSESNYDEKNVETTNTAEVLSDHLIKIKSSELISKKMEEFALKIWKEFEDSSNEDANTIFSPFSLFNSLMALRTGTKKKSREELNNVLGTENVLTEDFSQFIEPLFNNTDENFILKSANKLFIQKGLKLSRGFRNEFNQLQSDKRSVNFADSDKTRSLINKYVKSKTRNLIKNLVPPEAITALTQLYFVNALYLKATWFFPFVKELTRDGRFRTSDSEYKTVKMMKSLHGLCRSYKVENTLVASVPLQNAKMEMVFVVPPLNNFSSPLLFEGRIMKKIIEMLESVSLSRCAVKMPKFDIEYSTNNLMRSLNSLGIHEIFGSGMNRILRRKDHRELFVSDMQHKAVIFVDESGIEAAAATGISIGLRSFSTPININKPFYFFIRHSESKIILFMGKYKGPSN